MSATAKDDDQIQDARINAYVDGELSAAEAAEVAAELTRNSALANNVATLSRLKAELRATAEPASGLDLADLHVPFRRRRVFAFAAALLLVALVGITARVTLWPVSEQSQSVAIWKLHDHWVEQSSSAAGHGGETIDQDRPAGAAGGRFQTRFPQASHDLYLPDLSAARLMLAHTEFIANGAEAMVLHAGYVGSRGCRISLFVFAEQVSAGTDMGNPTGNAADAPAAPPSADLVAAAMAAAADAAMASEWRIGSLHFVALARGMDPAHFATVADTIRRLTIEQQPPDGDTEMILAQSRASAAPCQA